MKKLLMTLVLGVGALFTGGQALAQIPVIDVAQITVHEMSQAQNIAKYIEMIAQYKQQIDQMKQQYDSLTGSRGLGEIFNNPQMRDYLPAEWQDVYDRVQSGGYSGLTGSAKAITDANNLLGLCTNYTGEQKTVCERSAVKGAQDKAFGIEAFDKAKERWDQIASLMKQINSTTDAKGIAELQARINSEVAAIQNEQTKLQMYALASAAEDKIIAQQQRSSSVQRAGADSQYLDLDVDE